MSSLATDSPFLRSSGLGAGVVDARLGFLGTTTFIDAFRLTGTVFRREGEDALS
jgi:hypothetical protein